ncbi:hypothetical protein [Actinoplanes sp. N902-109]|uniref:hypothetical protein n=1 Tax=Actinoplanes sp. (strain N902-109) TaxID=649831 RepID=UPI0012FB142C|nr:hypothetical protein [Actinoplanes sp. N902-109]
MNRDWLRREIVRCATTATQNLSVARIDAAQTEVGAATSQLRLPAGSNVHGLSVQVSLAATREAQQLAKEWEELQAQLGLRRLNNQLEIERLHHLREEIFKKPEVARTYWLDRHPEALDGVLDDRFEQIAEKLGSAPGPSTSMIAGVLQEFVSDLGAEDRKTLIDLVGRLLVAFSRPDLVDRLPQDIP